MTAAKSVEVLAYVNAELTGPNRLYWEQVAQHHQISPGELRHRVWQLAVALLTEDSSECKATL